MTSPDPSTEIADGGAERLPITRTEWAKLHRLLQIIPAELSSAGSGTKDYEAYIEGGLSSPVPAWCDDATGPPRRVGILGIRISKDGIRVRVLPWSANDLAPRGDRSRADHVEVSKIVRVEQAV